MAAHSRAHGPARGGADVASGKKTRSKNRCFCRLWPLAFMNSNPQALADLSWGQAVLPASLEHDPQDCLRLRWGFCHCGPDFSAVVGKNFRADGAMRSLSHRQKLPYPGGRGAKNPARAHGCAPAPKAGANQALNPRKNARKNPLKSTHSLSPPSRLRPRCPACAIFIPHTHDSRPPQASQGLLLRFSTPCPKVIPT